MNDYVVCILVCILLFPGLYYLYKIGDDLDLKKWKERRKHNDKIRDE